MAMVVRRTLLLLLWGLLLFGQIPLAAAQGPPTPWTLPGILEFDRKLCPICREAEQIIQAVNTKYPGQFVVRKLYMDEEPTLFQRYKVAIVPTQVFLDASGREVFRHEGVFPAAQLEQKLRELKFVK